MIILACVCSLIAALHDSPTCVNHNFITHMLTTCSVAQDLLHQSISSVPFISPFGLTMMPALPSEYMNAPSRGCHALCWQMKAVGMTRASSESERGKKKRLFSMWPGDER